MLRTILLPIEEDHHGAVATDHLWDIAPLYGSRVYGLRVIDTESLEEGMRETEEARRLLDREVHQHLEAFEQTCREKELAWQTEVIIGEPIEEIALASPKADLMIMGEMRSVSGAENTERKAFVRNVLHRATRPMLIARDGHERLYHLVVGYDGSEKAGHALQLGADLAERAGAPLSVVTAADTLEYGMRLMDDVTVYLEAYTLTEWHPVVFEGPPSEALSKTVSDTGADMLIIGSHGHGRLHELAFGSTTNFVLDNIRSSILVYR